MFNVMLVSFIVPVYNGEKTIERCLSSICNLREKNIEIIAVNDGSTDCTKDILENLAQADKSCQYTEWWSEQC